MGKVTVSPHVLGAFSKVTLYPFFFCHRGFMRDTKRGFTKPGVSIPLKVSTNYHYSFMFYS
jgi:hypothetical protein